MNVATKVPMTGSTPVTISAPNIKVAILNITGTAPLMTARFAKKAELMAKMAEGKSAGSKRARPAREYEKDAAEAAYLCSQDRGKPWHGINASSFRNAMISACRLVGFKMTLAKLSLFIEPDGFDDRDGTPLVKIDAPKFEVNTMHVRNATGVVDIRARPLWRPGWKAQLKVRYDADQFTADDVANLVMRIGAQVGIGEGRPDSKSSAGLGFGLFTIDK